MSTTRKPKIETTPIEITLTLTPEQIDRLLSVLIEQAEMGDAALQLMDAPQMQVVMAARRQRTRRGLRRLEVAGS